MNDDFTIHDREALRKHAEKVIAVMDDDLTKGDIIFVLAFAAAGALMTASENKKMLKAAPKMFAKLLREILRRGEA